MQTSSSTSATPRLTVAILTLNEAKRIGNCIKSAAFADEIIVVDAGSTDETIEIAQALGAEVYAYPAWEGFATQRNRLLAHATGDYIFFLDADEELSSALREEIKAVTATGEKAVWKLRWLQIAFGRPLTRMVSSGTVERLFWRTDIVRFEGVVHEHAVLHQPRPMHQLRQKLPHHSRETVHASLLKLAQYVQHGALKRVIKNKSAGGIARGFLSGFSIFIRLYIFRRGFLCGAEGFLYCLFSGLEGFFRYAALRYDREQLQTLIKR